jgi:hypothetical protein
MFTKILMTYIKTFKRADVCGRQPRDQGAYDSTAVAPDLQPSAAHLRDAGDRRATFLLGDEPVYQRFKSFVARD